MRTFKTYAEAVAALPLDSEWTSSFGYPGQGGYTEFWQLPDGARCTIGNGSWCDVAPFTWTLKPAPAPPTGQVRRSVA